MRWIKNFLNIQIHILFLIFSDRQSASDISNVFDKQNTISVEIKTPTYDIPYHYITSRSKLTITMYK